MKMILDEEHMTIYLSKMYLETIDFEDQEELEAYFRGLFSKLQKVYQLDIGGYYNIDVYTDSNYGAILEIEKEELDYLDYYDHQIDMRIVLHPISFLYQLKEYEKFNPQKYETIYYHNYWYIHPKGQLSNIEIGELLEHTTIYYQNNHDVILKCGKRICT